MTNHWRAHHEWRRFNASRTHLPFSKRANDAEPPYIPQGALPGRIDARPVDTLHRVLLLETEHELRHTLHAWNQRPARYHMSAEDKIAFGEAAHTYNLATLRLRVGEYGEFGHIHGADLAAKHASAEQMAALARPVHSLRFLHDYKSRINKRIETLMARYDALENPTAANVFALNKSQFPPHSAYGEDKTTIRLR